MKRVLVIGDVIADVYRECHFKKMCPDAPGVKALVEGSHEMRPGGAANVALNLAALAPDCVVDLIGVMTSDLAARIKQLSGNRVNMDFSYLVGINGGHIQKDRIFHEGELVVRVDSRVRINQFMREQVGQYLRQYLANHDPDLVIMSDYDGGALYGPGREDGTNLQILLSMRERLLVDTKLTDLSVFDGTLGIKLNREEWARVHESGEAAPERFFGFMVVTLGRDGAQLWWHQRLTDVRSVTHRLDVRGYDVPVRDVCGCGDTFLAGIAAMMMRNPDPFTAVQFANAAAATVVTKPRTAVADREMALKLIGRTE